MHQSTLSRFSAEQATPNRATPDRATSNQSTSKRENETGEHVLGQYIPLLYHYNMLQDEDRVGAFGDAINYLVSPGMRVLELGGGTGILSSFAARRGAVVTCVERNPELVHFARNLLAQNGLANQVDVIEMDATEFVPDEPVDVVVCEMLHVGLLREKQAQVIAAFKKRYRQAHGPRMPVFIPDASVLMAQPVHQSFDFAGYYAPVPMFQAPLSEQPRTTEIAPLSAYATIQYNESIPMQFKFSEVFHATIDASVNAVRFVTQNVLAIDEKQQKAITWPNQCLVLPIDSPFDVGEKEPVEMFFNYSAGGEVGQLASSLRVSPSHTRV